MGGKSKERKKIEKTLEKYIGKDLTLEEFAKKSFEDLKSKYKFSLTDKMQNILGSKSDVVTPELINKLLKEDTTIKYPQVKIKPIDKKTLKHLSKLVDKSKTELLVAACLYEKAKKDYELKHKALWEMFNMLYPEYKNRHKMLIDNNMFYDLGDKIEV